MGAISDWIISTVTSKTITIAGVGEVLLESSRRAKHINISLKPFKGVRVAVPRGVSYARAEAVARSKVDWIKRHIKRMGAVEKTAAELRKSGPVDREMARRQLVGRLAELARQHGFEYNRVFIRNQKTRWGSCSAKNNINLNLNLVRLPHELIDYILLHELVHTRVKNHGRQFWDELNTLMDNAKGIDRQLNRYKAMLV